MAGTGITAHKADAAAHPKDARVLYGLHSPPAHELQVGKTRVRLRLTEPHPTDPDPHTTINLSTPLVAALHDARHDPELFEDVAYELAMQVLRLTG